MPTTMVTPANRQNGAAPIVAEERGTSLELTDDAVTDPYIAALLCQLPERWQLLSWGTDDG